MPTAGLDAPPEAVAALYAEFDADHSGSVSYAELTQQLRDAYCATPELSEQNEGVPRVRFALRKGAERGLSPARTPEAMPPQMGHFCKLDVDWGFDEESGFEYLELSGDSLQEKLRTALKKGWCRVKDLFVSWDSSSDGTVSRHEFAEAMRVMGLHAPAAAIDGIFCSFDPGSSGWVRSSPSPLPPSTLIPTLDPTLALISILPFAPSPLSTLVFALTLTFALTFALSMSACPSGFTSLQSTHLTQRIKRSKRTFTHPTLSLALTFTPPLPFPLTFAPAPRPCLRLHPTLSHPLTPSPPLLPCVGRLRGNA